MPDNKCESYDCYCHNGHILAEINSERCLIDSGAIQSLGVTQSLILAKNSYALQHDFVGHDVNTIGRLVGTQISVLIGADILNTLNTVIDLAAGKMMISRNLLPFHGLQISTRYLYGIPIISCFIADQQIDLILDSGSKLSYLDSTIALKYPRVGENIDFFIGFGEFRTEVYQAPVRIAGFQFNHSVGVLPKPLQNTLSLFQANGIIGVDLFDEFAVSLSSGTGGVMLKHHDIAE
jgi:hypothetical protein